MATKSETAASLPPLVGACRCAASVAAQVGRRPRPQPPVYAFFATGTGTPAIFTFNEPRLARVQK